MAEVLETARRGRRPELEYGVEDPLGRHRIEHSPGERERLGPVPEGAVPAIGVPEALLHVTNRLVRDGAPATRADERPLVLRLLIRERMSRREDRSKLLAEEALAREPGEERPDGAAEKTLADRGTGGVLNHRAVEQQGAGDLHLERTLEIPRHQLGGDGSAHVVGDHEDGSSVPLTIDELLDQVGLPVQGVVLIAGLLG